MRKRRPLLVGAAALFAAGLASRLIGTVYRVLLARHAGDEVLGLFQLTLPLYRLAATLASFGFPVAIAKRSAEALGRNDPERARELQATGLGLIVLTSVLTGGVLFASAGLWASTVLAAPRTEATVRVLALLLVPTAFSAGLRGALQGNERLVPIAVANLVEALSRAPLVLYLVALVSPQGPAAAAAAIAAGLTVAEILATLFLAAAAGVGRPRLPGLAGRRGRVRFLTSRHVPLSRSLLELAPPVAGAGLLNGLMSLLAVALIPRQLALTGLDASAVARAYGQFSGMVVPLLYMPMVAIGPIVQVVIPAVSHRVARGGPAAVNPLLRRAFGAAGAVAAGASCLFLLFPAALGERLYGMPELGPLIWPLACAAPFTYLGHVASGILYGLGRTGTVMANAFCGNLLRLLLIHQLAGQPGMGIHGVLWAAVVDHVATGLLHLAVLPSALRRAGAPPWR